MFQFNLFRIPIRVTSGFWFLCLIFSGILFRDFDEASIRLAIIWIAVVFLSILAHELGHALVGRKLGGGFQEIELNGMGGLAIHHGARFDRNSKRKMVAAGPGTSLAIGLLTILGLILARGFDTALDFTGMSLLGSKFWFTLTGRVPTQDLIDLITVLKEYGGVYFLIDVLLFVNIWWSFINLLPIYPLDGGQILETFLKSPKTLFFIGTITATTVAVFALLSGHMFLAVMMGFFAYQNWQLGQQLR